jgi:hypothetical protein
MTGRSGVTQLAATALEASANTLRQFNQLDPPEQVESLDRDGKAPSRKFRKWIDRPAEGRHHGLNRWILDPKY